MRIAVLASRDGEKALYIHDFFKEGNRIAIDCLITEDPDSPVASRFRREGVEVIPVSELPADLPAMLKGRDVELIVVDDFEAPLPAGLAEAFGEAVVHPTEAHRAPLEIIETSDRLKAPRQERQETNSADTGSARPAVLSPEEEWESVLSSDNETRDSAIEEEQRTVNDDTPRMHEDSNPEPQNPGHGHNQEQPYNQQEGYNQRQPYNQQEGYNQGQPYYQQGGYNQGNGGYYNRLPDEPMPDNYLVWSVVITILCCLIPGIIAIIYSASVSSKYYRGDLAGAKRASRNAQIWCIISVVAGILWATLYLPLTLFLS